MKERASEVVGKQIIRSILNGTRRIHETLPQERELALRFQVERPTIREALQRLEKEGWITIQKGAPAVVNDYWKQGNIMTIANILEHHEVIPDEFIEHMLELRVSLMPAIMRDAVKRQQLRVIALFVGIEELEDEPEAYAAFDWRLQTGTAKLTSNPIYQLIHNSCSQIYHKVAGTYFLDPSNRDAARSYYDKLLDAALRGDESAAEATVRAMMGEWVLRGFGCWMRVLDESGGDRFGGFRLGWYGIGLMGLYGVNGLG
ncbi:GntR family transcriptional regulator [Rossellomorea aquimaris]|uniref:GntR family transcriptional regulator n=1 Tax=Rossellomorea aquimaris TaxID=189382 RepID=UPI001CD55929|nr:GntR family transcriptional regulator [Rossellomorea aquimaris]MCA1054973.1 GntR family transcriptional regulator [Rossellomorea aquimaris]